MKDAGCRITNGIAGQLATLFFPSSKDVVENDVAILLKGSTTRRRQQYAYRPIHLLCHRTATGEPFNKVCKRFSVLVQPLLMIDNALPWLERRCCA